MLKYLFCLSLLFAATIASAQKDAPIAGNAANLVDLLKKNYYALDPNMKDEELARDRTLVISIFKSYLTEAERESLATEIKNYTSEEKTKKLTNSLKTMNAFKQELTALSSASSSLSIDKTPVQSTSIKLDQEKRTYFKLVFERDSAELNMLINAYKENLSINSVLSSFVNKYEVLEKNSPDALAGANYNSSLQKSIPFIGGNMGFETYVDGLARFLAKRIKDELTVYSIENIQKWLNNNDTNDPLAEFKVILPSTTAFIKNFNADKLSSFPNELKQYIEDDLNHLLTNTAKLKTIPRIDTAIKKYPNLELAFEALNILPALSNIKYPIDYFKLLESSETFKKWKKEKDTLRFNLANTIEMANLLAYSMIVIENDEPKFAGSSFLASYANETTFYKLYTGFLYQQNEKYYNISFIKKDTQETLSKGLKKLVQTNSTTYKDSIASILFDIAKHGEKVYTTALEIRQSKKTGKKIGADTVLTFVNSIIDLSDQMISSGNTLATTLLHAKGDTTFSSTLNNTRSYFKIARSGNEIIYDLQKKRYATALTKSLQIATLDLPNSKISSHATSMINFVNGMASAKDAEEAEKTIEAFALPTGSYSIKRKSKFNLSLNSYPGVLPALELTWKDKTTYGAFSFGFTAPVGLSFTWGNSCGSSIGFFIPVIDIGALTRFRLDNSSTTKALPELKFSNIFSPGLYIHYGFKNSPLSILIGGQYGPDLKEVTSSDTNIEISKTYESVRLGIGLVLDIPLLNIQTKSKL